MEDNKPNQPNKSNNGKLKKVVPQGMVFKGKHYIPGQEPAPVPSLNNLVSKSELRKAGIAGGGNNGNGGGSKTKAKARRERKNDGLPVVKCVLCNYEARCLTTHLKQVHGLNAKDYVSKYGAPIFAPDLLQSFKQSGNVGAANDWNQFVKLYNWADDIVRAKVIKVLEDETGITLIQVRQGVIG